MDLISGGSFGRKLKICHVDYTKFTSSDSLLNLRQYAQLLIHEATHGLLFDKGILYDEETRERVERLCRLEEYRFAQHFEPGYADTSVRPFNSDWYKTYWDDKTRRAAQWKRLWEVVKASRKAEKDAKDGGAVEQIPMDAKAFNDLGESYQRKGNDAMAISYFSHALQLDPQFARAYNNRGYAYHCEGRYDEAIQDYDRAILFDSKFARAHSNRGLTYRMTGEYDKAIADYNLAIQLKPKFALAYSNRGYARHCQGEYTHAIADFDRAIQLDPTYTTAYFNRGRTHRALGNYESAIADYSRVIDLDPKYASAYNNLAWLLATCPQPSLRDGKKAVENATKACELFEWKNPSAVNTLALAYAEVSDFENALKWQIQYSESPDLSIKERAEAKLRFAVYEAHLRGDHKGKLGRSCD
jgi:tetratricopeptide (TPR) repeat protein